MKRDDELLVTGALTKEADAERATLERLVSIYKSASASTSKGIVSGVPWIREGATVPPAVPGVGVHDGEAVRAARARGDVAVGLVDELEGSMLGGTGESADARVSKADEGIARTQRRLRAVQLMSNPEVRAILEEAEAVEAATRAEFMANAAKRECLAKAVTSEVTKELWAELGEMAAAQKREKAEKVEKAAQAADDAWRRARGWTSFDGARGFRR